MQAMYRRMLPEDEEVVFELRMRTWGHPSVEYVRQNAYSDPLYLRHTFVALAPDGTLLSTIRYWLRHIRDSQGTPRLVGCVASVVTIEAARRQGHARELMQLAISSMRDEGCDWSLLFSSSMGMALYENLGYHLYEAPYFRGTFTVACDHEAGCYAGSAHAESYKSDPDTKGSYSVNHIVGTFDMADDHWLAVRRIYSAYNAHRPLTVLRDEDYWQGYFAQHLSAILRQGPLFLLLSNNKDQPVAYLLVHLLQPQTAREFFSEECGFIISEAGVLPGHKAALPSLLSAAGNHLRLLLFQLGSQRLPQWHGLKLPEPKKTNMGLSGAIFLPSEAPVEEGLRSLFGATLRKSNERRRVMALPLRDSISERDLASTFLATDAFFWPIDSF